MKRYVKRKYWHFLKRHFCFMIIAWVLISYFCLQAAYGTIFTAAKHRSTVRFYEGMETIQYLMKDAELLDAEVEIKDALSGMSYAGDYYVSRSENPLIRDYGSIMGLPLKWITPFAMFEDRVSTDGLGEVHLNGVGKGVGFILDAETNEVTFDSLWKENVETLWIHKNKQTNLGDVKDATYLANQYDRLYCPIAKLEPVLRELEEIKNKRYEEQGSSWTGKRLKWKLVEIYVKKDQFYPAKVSLNLVSSTEIAGGTRQTYDYLETVEIDPPEAEGYQRHGIDPVTENAIDEFLNLTPERLLSEKQSYYGDKEPWTPDESFYATAYESVLTHQGTQTAPFKRIGDMGEAWSVGNPLLYFLNGEMIFARTAYFQDGSGHLYKACAYQSISNLFRDNLRAVAVFELTLAVFLMLLAFMTAFVAYKKNKHVFMTREYSIMLMDSMAHDLKTPLMAAGGYADNLREHLNDEKREHYAEQIQKCIAYVNDIVMNHLEILKLDLERKKFRRKDVELRKIFEEVLEKYQGKMEEKSIMLSMEGQLSTKGDETLLKQMAENLVTNAMRYTPEKGAVQIIFEKHGFCVENETNLEYKGSLKHLWDPFVRGDESRSGQGNGMGLAIVASILDRHGWKYRLKYDPEKKTFACIVKIPVGILF